MQAEGYHVDLQLSPRTTELARMLSWRKSGRNPDLVTPISGRCSPAGASNDLALVAAGRDDSDESKALVAGALLHFSQAPGEGNGAATTTSGVLPSLWGSADLETPANARGLPRWLAQDQ